MIKQERLEKNEQTLKEGVIFKQSIDIESLEIPKKIRFNKKRFKATFRTTQFSDEYSGSQTDQALIKFLNNVQQIYADTIILMTQGLQIIQSLINVNLSTVRIIYLQQCGILSFQPLQRINIQSLENLYVFNNDCCFIQSFRKINSKKFKRLSLRRNYITNFSPLSELKSYQEFLVWTFYQYILKIHDDLSWIIKSECKITDFSLKRQNFLALSQQTEQLCQKSAILNRIKASKIYKSFQEQENQQEQYQLEKQSKGYWLEEQDYSD